jgi:hypothetical protein
MSRKDPNRSFWEALESQMSATMAERRDRSVSVRSFLTNSVAALLGCGWCAAYAGVLLARAMGFDPASHDSNLFMWYSPLIWWAGLVFGFVASWRSRNAVACFTWLSGAVLLGLLLADLFWATLSWERAIMAVFPLRHGESSPDDQLGFAQLFVVWPALNSLTYSIGATLALLFGDKKSD